MTEREREAADRLADAAQKVIDDHTLPINGGPRWRVREEDPLSDLLEALNLYRVATMDDTYGLENARTGRTA